MPGLTQPGDDSRQRRNINRHFRTYERPSNKSNISARRSWQLSPFRPSHHDQTLVSVIDFGAIASPAVHHLNLISLAHHQTISWMTAGLAAHCCTGCTWLHLAAEC